jgi:hypothetical protein
MDRSIVYAGVVPLETDVLSVHRNVMVGLGWLTRGVFGTNTFCTDITVTANTPTAMDVVVNPGQIFSLEQTDPTNYSSLLTDSHMITKQGILFDQTVLPLTAPGANSQIYLIQAGFQESDDLSIVLPFYNPADPAISFSGPNGGGAASNTRRKARLIVSAKPGVPAVSPTAPAPDAGYVGLYTVVVGSGASVITSGNITRLTTAPLLTLYGTLPKVPEGVQRGFWIYGTDSGAANALIVSDVMPAITSYTAGQGFRIKVGATNSGAATVNVSGMGARSIVRADGTAVKQGDLLQGSIVEVVYDGTNFQLVSAGVSNTNTPSRDYLIFTSTQSWTVPPGVYRVLVELWGGGGGGGATNSAQVFPAHGGGGGGYALGWISVTPGAVMTVSVGVGGNPTILGGGQATAGGTSSVGPSISATGGGAGANGGATQGSQGASGVGSGGALNIPGGTSGGFFRSTAGDTVIASRGGDSARGGAGGIASTGSAAPGLIPGGGGGGGGTGSYAGTGTGAPGSGGAGARGAVLITW